MLQSCLPIMLNRCNLTLVTSTLIISILISSSVSASEQLIDLNRNILSTPYSSKVQSEKSEQWIATFDRPMTLDYLESELMKYELTVQHPLFDDRFWVIEGNVKNISRFNYPSLVHIEPNLQLQRFIEANDSRYPQQWSLSEEIGGINLPSAHDISLGDSTRIAILDTGFVPHYDLDQNRIGGADLIMDASNARDQTSRDTNAVDEGDYRNLMDCPLSPLPSNSSWHGSHVAGISSAVTDNKVGMVGVAPLSQYIPVRVLGTCGGRISDIADGIAWAAGARVSGLPLNPHAVDVINMSLGGTGRCSAALQAAIDFAVNRNISVVVAAGNNNEDAINTTPANCQNVITVASIGRDGAKASYSNFGDVVDIAAPGGGNGGLIISTVDAGDQKRHGATFNSYQGTSMAAPHVAGVVALLRSIEPLLTARQVEDLLKRSARPFPHACSQCGSGILDAFAALQLLGVDHSDPKRFSDNVFNEQIYGGERYTAIEDAISIMRRVTIPGNTGLEIPLIPFVENGFLTLQVRHNGLDELEITATLPDNTEVDLPRVQRERNFAVYELQLAQQPPGNYEIRIRDNQAGNYGFVNDVRITAINTTRE